MRTIVAIVGSGRPDPVMEAAARRAGKAVVDLGGRVLTGGRVGVMAAASAGARDSDRYREGDVIGLLPGYDRSEANPWVDIVLPTGLGHARNVLIAVSEVVVVVGGAEGAMSEASLAHKLGGTVVIVDGTGGTADLLAEHWRGRERVVITQVEGLEQALAGVLSR